MNPKPTSAPPGSRWVRCKLKACGAYGDWHLKPIKPKVKA